MITGDYPFLRTQPSVVQGFFVRLSATVAALLISCVAPALMGSPATAQSTAQSAIPSNIESLVQAAMRGEDKLSVFKATLHEVEEEYPTPKAALIKMFRNDPKMLATELDIASYLPEQTVKNYTLIQNKSTQRLVLFGTLGPATTFRDYYGQEGSIIYNERPFEDQISREATIATPGSNISPLDRVWSGTFWHREYSEMKAHPTKMYLTASGTPGAHVIYIPAQVANSDDVRVYLSNNSEPVLQRVSLFDPKSGELMYDFKIDYQQLPEGGKYPTRAELTYYIKATSTRILHLHETTTLVKFEKFGKLPTSDLSFGDMPVGTRVQDDRFKPPLTYIQKEHHLTDPDIFDMVQGR